MTGQPQESAGPTPGQRLRAAREARGLGVAAAARELHLDPAVIDALEADRCGEVDAPVFVRGYLRSYARLLGLAEDSVLGSCAAATPTIAAAPATGRRRAPLERRPAVLTPWLAVVVLVLGVLGFLLRDADFGSSPEVAAPPVRSAPSLGAIPAPVAAEAVAAPDFSMPQGDADVPGDDPESAQDDPAAADAFAEAGERLLALRFAETSWVEISDRHGRLLYAEVPAGAWREMRGEPPFRLTLGNAPGVEIFLDGEPYPLAETRPATSRVLRLAIGDEGGSGAGTGGTLQ